MRSAHGAVACRFTLIAAGIAGACMPSQANAAAATDFIIDCPAEAPNAADGRLPMVLGRRSAGNGAFLLAAAGQNGIFETRDGGTTWAQLTPPGKCHQPVRAFWDNNPDGELICVVTPPNEGGYNTYCSRDRGRSWEAQTWIKDAVHVLFDPTDAGRAFGWTPTNHCRQTCPGPTYTIAMAHAKRSHRYCACNLQLAHTAGPNARLLGLRDDAGGGANQLVSFSRDTEVETLEMRGVLDTNYRAVGLYTNPLSDQSWLVTYAERSPFGQEPGLCCDGIAETINGGIGINRMKLFFGPLDSVQFTSPYGDIAALVHPPHAGGTAYIGRRSALVREWSWERAPENRGQLVAAGGMLYFAGRHLYRVVQDQPYTVIDPIQ